MNLFSGWVALVVSGMEIMHDALMGASQELFCFLCLFIRLCEGGGEEGSTNYLRWRRNATGSWFGAKFCRRQVGDIITSDEGGHDGTPLTVNTSNTGSNY